MLTDHLTKPFDFRIAFRPLGSKLFGRHLCEVLEQDFAIAVPKMGENGVWWNAVILKSLELQCLAVD